MFISTQISSMENLKGKNVLIAGATGGIGSKAAKLIAGSGAHVFITGRNTDRLNRVATECGIPDEHAFIMDLADVQTVKTAIQKITEMGIELDIVVNAAGIGIIKPMDTLTTDDLLDTLNANLVGPFNLLKAVLPGMKARKKGLIIHIPGVLGKVPMAGAAAYSASKYGLTGMMQSIREELKRTDIRITNLFLGGVDSPFWDTIDLRVQKDKMIVAEEAAKAIWFLCQQPLSGVVSEMVLQPFNHQAI